MIHWRREGDRIRPGLNVYPPGEPCGVGFQLLAFGHVLWVRRNRQRRWFVRLERFPAIFA
jgi:hypothetical protein